MKKNSIRGYVVLGVVLAVFLVVSLVIPFAKTAAYWTAFAFGIVSIVFQLYVFKASAANDGNAKSRFYGFPIARVGVIYLAVQLAFSIVEMIVSKWILQWLPAIINVIFLALAIIGCVATEAMKEEIEKQDDKIKKNVKNIRNLQSMSATLTGFTEDKTLKAELQKLADEFKYSDPVSSDDTEELENEMKTELDEIQKAVIDGDNDGAVQLCRKLIVNLKERNRICSLNK